MTQRLDTLRVAFNTPRFGTERCQTARLWPYKQLGILILRLRLRRLLSPTPTPTATATATPTATRTPTATPTPAPPNPPSNLSGSVPSRTQVNLLWTDNANNETGFTLQRADAGVGGGGPCRTFVTIQPSLPANKPDLTILAYRQTIGIGIVRAFNGGGNSSWSDSVSIRTH